MRLDMFVVRMQRMFSVYIVKILYITEILMTRAATFGYKFDSREQKGQYVRASRPPEPVAPRSQYPPRSVICGSLAEV